jgi:acetyl/propionyl-CoA carboxylase alpha subunit
VEEHVKTVTFHIDGKDVTGTVLKQGGVLWAHINGRTLVYESESAKSQKKKHLIEDPAKIFAPMPGKIIKVLCEEGDKVSKDQTLVVMEAMKMEYSLKIHANGTVRKLNAKAGAQAALGDLLVDVEAAP